MVLPEGPPTISATSRSSGTKRCTLCGIDKPLSDYHTSKRQRDGHVARCRDCANTVRNQRRRANPDARRNERGKPRRASSRPLDPIRVAARRQLTNAIKRGDLLRPGQCCICHKVCTPEGHHYDYTKPLDVLWLCAKCHKREHAGTLWY